MVVAHSRPRLISFTEESTFAETQSDFDNNGELVYVIDVAVDGLKQQSIENRNSVGRAGERHKNILGLKSKGNVSFSTYLHGNPTVAASGSQAAAFHISKFLQNALGGQLRSQHQGVGVGSTTTSVVLDDSTGISAGMGIAVWDASASELAYTEVVSVSGNTLTVKPDLPFTPVEGDACYGTITLYFDWDSLTDNTDTQHTTLGMYIKGEDDEDSYRLRAVKLNATLSPIVAGEPTMISFEGQCLSFDNSGLTAPSMTGSVSGETPLAAGTGDDTRFYFGDKNTTLTETDAFVLEPVLGLTHQQVEGPNGEEGVHHYNATAPGEPGLTVALHYSASYAVDFEAQTEKAALIQVGTQLSSSFGIYFPRLEYGDDPSRSSHNDRTSNTLTFRALEDDLTTSATGDGLEALRSAVKIYLVS